MTFGRMPLANGFLTRDQIATEYFYELMPAVCSPCGTFQLVEQPPPELMFHPQYPFVSSSSPLMQTHFRAFADAVIRNVLRDRIDPLVVEIGSNDGTMLRRFKEAGYRHLGIDPAKNPAALASVHGVETLTEFFNECVAGRVLADHGHASVVLAANVLSHIPDVHSVAEGVARLLAPDGILMFEDPYLGDMVARTAYDQIYDEHVFIFSATAVGRAFGPHGLELIDVAPLDTHGGSMRYSLAHHGRYPASPAVDRLLESEQRRGLADGRTFEAFSRRCEASRGALTTLVEELCRTGKRIAGYGATSKSTTITNYCGFGPQQIEFVVDTTPAKQGKLTPGSHIPVHSPEAFRGDPPAFAILFAWNHAREILANEHGFSDLGGRWISPLQISVQEDSLVIQPGLTHSPVTHYDLGS